MDTIHISEVPDECLELLCVQQKPRQFEGDFGPQKWDFNQETSRGAGNSNLFYVTNV